MSLLDSIFGAGTQSTLLGNNTNTTSQLANTAFNQAYNNYQAQMARQQGQQLAFNQALGNWNTNPYANRSSHQWVFNNKPCTLQEFADNIWGADEHPDKMLFILAHAGPATADK
jgi:hypothetical protein